MGSFTVACAVSGLPIDDGDPVRILLLTRCPYEEEDQSLVYDPWLIRTPDLKAVYNSYGSVEDVEEGVARDVWLQALDLDLIECGVGENSVHDVSVRKGMSFEELLDALREKRVRVTSMAPTVMDLLYEEKKRYFKEADALLDRLSKEAGMPEAPRREEEEKPEEDDPKIPPPEVPTLDRVEDALRAVGIEVRMQTDQRIDAKSAVACDVGPLPMSVVVRPAAFGPDEDTLGNAVKALQSSYACVMYSTGSDQEVLVLPRHDKTFNFYPSSSLAVGLAMVREDVWQAVAELAPEKVNEAVFHGSGAPYCIGPDMHDALVSRDHSPEVVTAWRERYVEFTRVLYVLGRTGHMWHPVRSVYGQSPDYTWPGVFLHALTKAAAALV